MRPKQVIAVDADDVLGNENHAIMHFINEQYGRNHTPDDYNVTGQYGPYWEDIWKVGDQGKEWYNAYVNAKAKGKVMLQPLPRAIGTMRILHKNYELVVITSRKGILLDVTKQWLQEHFPNLFTDVHFVELWGVTEKVTKAKICNDIGAVYLIDDNVEHCALAQETGVQSLLFGDYGWNRDVDIPEGVFRVRDWYAVQEYFNEQPS